MNYNQILILSSNDSDTNLLWRVAVDNKWLIVEANPSFASGIYNCDPELVFKTIIEASIKDIDLTDENKKFVFRKGDYNG